MHVQVFGSNVKFGAHLIAGQTQLHVDGIILFGGLHRVLAVLHSQLQVIPFSEYNGLNPQFLGSHPQVQVLGLNIFGERQKTLSDWSQTQLQVFGSTLKLAGHLMSGHSQLHFDALIFFGNLQSGLA